MISNTYPESVEESGKYLRMTLQSISKNKLPYNPISYLMWYEYAIGRDEQLIKDIKLLIEKKKPIDSNIITKLFKKHMVDNQALLAEKKAREFQKILAEMTSYLSKSSNEIDTQGNIVDTYTKELSQTTSLDTISKIAKSIISETKSIVESSKTLKGQVDSTRAEINILSKELEGIKQVAKIDMLTGFLTGGDLMRRWADVLEKRKTTHEPVSVIMLDIDHFKNVNDTYGHLIGDNILQMLSKLLKERMTPCTRQKRPVEIKRLLSLILRNNLTKISFLCS